VAANDDTFLIAPELVANQLPGCRDPDTVEATQPFAATYTVASLLANDVDPDGDIVLLVKMDSASARGGTVTLAGGTVRYMPAAQFQPGPTPSRTRSRTDRARQ